MEARITNKIGEYIHWNYSNYLEEPNAEYDWNFQIQSEIMAIARGGNFNPKIDVSKLQSDLDYFYGDGQNSSQMSEEQQSIVREIIEEKLKEYSDRAIQEGDSVIRAGNNLGSKGKLGEGKTSSANVKTIMNRMEELAKLKNSGELLPDTLIQKIKHLEKEWREIQNNSKILINAAGGGRLKVNTTKRINFINDLNALFTTTNNAGLLKFIEGQRTELEVAIAEAMINKGLTTKESIEKEANKNIVGSLSTQKAVNPGSIGVNLDLTKSHSYVDKDKKVKTLQPYQKNEDDYFISARPTQDKVDIVISKEDRRLLASVKSTYLSKGVQIHLESGRDLLAMVQDDGYFVNHFLNIVPERIGGTVKESPGGNIRQSYITAMKTLIFGKALMGGRLTSEGHSPSANVFIVKDKAGKRFRVYSMEQVINLIIKDIENNLNVQLDDYINEWNASSETRISNLLLQLRAQEIDVSIRALALA